MKQKYMMARATISECQKYRYLLDRWWNNRLGVVNFVMLNPSTADGVEDDPTIRKCVGFAKLLGYGGIVVTNLFAFRSDDPKEMFKAASPIGQDNDECIRIAMKTASIVVAAWGANGTKQRSDVVLRIAKEFGRTLYHLGLTKEGKPRHPLYVAYETKLQEVASAH